MKKLFITFILCAPVALFAQKASIQKDISSMLAFNQQQISSLAQTIPAEKYDWRPADGVRSVAEVVLHIAEANYGLLASMGINPPDGINIKELSTISTEKEECIEIMNRSFKFATEQVKNFPEKNLSENVKLPFGEFNKQSVLLIMLDHSGEHKGQLIAYARMNDITPPWTAAKQKKDTEKGDKY